MRDRAARAARLRSCTGGEAGDELQNFELKEVVGTMAEDHLTHGLPWEPMQRDVVARSGRATNAPVQRAIANTWISSIDFVNAAGLRPQDGTFVSLSNFPSFDRNDAGKERTIMSFGFF
jgi:hypothetical protein